MAKTKRELPPDKLLERILNVAELLLSVPDSDPDDHTATSTTPIVKQTEQNP